VARTRPLSDAELLAYSREHLRYEMWMFLRLGECLPEVPVHKNELDKVVGNALIEGFVVHLRNLIGFFYPDKVASLDVIAEDFFMDPDTWEQIRPQVSRTLQEARDRAHREIAHLTTARISGTPPKKAWPIAALMAEMRVLMKLFADLASSQRLHPSVKDLLSRH